MEHKKWIPQKAASDNGIAAIKNLLLHLNVKVRPETVSEILISDPDYPSISALSNALHQWNIESMMVRLEAKDLVSIPLPAVAHISDNQGTEKYEHYVVLMTIDDETITYIDMKKGYVTEKTTLFLPKWSGITLLAEASNKSGEANYEEIEQETEQAKFKKKVLYSGTLLVLLAVVIYGVMKISSGLWVLIFGIKTLGTAFSFVLLNYTFGGNKAVLNRICSLGKRKKDAEESGCIAGVLDSPAAKLWGWLSMSEIGVVYFVGGLLTLIVAIFSTQIYEVLTILAVVNIIALPYTIFSVYYQAVVVKKWCTTCLSIQVLLWLEFFTFLTLWNENSTNLSEAFFIVFFGFATTVLVWAIMRPGFGMADKLIALRKKVDYYEGHPLIFESALNTNNIINQDSVKGEIVMGNPDAKDILIIVSSPFCSLCLDVHNQLEKLLDTFGNEIRIVLRIAGNPVFEIEESYQKLKEAYENLTTDEERKEFVKTYGKEDTWIPVLKEELEESLFENDVIMYLLELSETNEVVRKAMNDLYIMEYKTPKAIAEWKSKYPVDANLQKDHKFELDAINDWMNTVGIEGTPSLFFNGIQLTNKENILTGLKGYVRYKENSTKERQDELGAPAIQ